MHPYYHDKQKANEEMTDCITWLITAPFKFFADRPWLAPFVCVLALAYVASRVGTWAAALSPYFK